jgi:hypothetical protein
MTTEDILKLRLANQQISRTDFKTPGELVAWFGAVQAQDYLNSKWAIGLRLKNSDEADIEQAIADKTIVRTWPMRGTLHYVSPENVRWMLELLTPRVIARAANIYKLAGLDKKIFLKSKKLIAKILEGGRLLTRNEIYRELEKGGISTASQRGLHILGKLAQESLICLGPRKGKQPTFTLLDEWLPPTKKLNRDEAIAKLTKSYFKSHGPATVQDFAWWSGLTATDIKQGLEMVKSELNGELIDGQTYWIGNRKPEIKNKPATAYLLPNFDEYLVSYKDRRLTVEGINANQLKAPGNYFFNPSIIIDGKVAGSWKRELLKDNVIIQIKPLNSVSERHKRPVIAEANRYASFLKLSPVILFK